MFDVDALQQELLCTAAQEACVLLARAAACSSKRPQRAYHGPARRIVRTLVSASKALRTTVCGALYNRVCSRRIMRALVSA